MDNKQLLFLISKTFLLLGAILVIFLGLFVYSRNKKSKINIYFSLFCVTISNWLFGTFMMFQNINHVSKALFWDHVIYTGVVFTPTFLYIFGLAFSEKKRVMQVYAAYFFSTSFLILNWSTKYLIDDVFIYDLGIHARAQVFHNYFLLFFFSYILIFLKDMYVLYTNARATKLEQAKYIFLAILFLATGGVFGFAPAYNVGIYLFAYMTPIVFVCLVAYAIVKHRLMDIRLLVLKSVAYTLTFALIAAGYISATVFIFQRLSPTISPLTLNIITLFILVFTFNPFRLFIERSTDKLFAKGRYNPAVLWRALDEINITYARQEDLTKRWLTTITDQMRISKAAFALMSSPISHIDSLNYEEKPLAEWQKLAVIIIGNDKTIVFDELDEGAPERDILREFKTEVLMPIKTKTSTIGMLVLGEKNSGDMYNNQDLNLLEDFVHRAAVALERSKELRQKEKEVVKVRALYNQAEKSISSTDLEYVLNATIDAAFMATDSDGGSIMLLDSEGGLIVKASRGISNEYKEKKIKMGEGIAGSIAETRKPRIIDSKDKELAKFLKRDQIYSAMCVPLEARGKLIGVLSVNRINNKAHFIKDDLDLVTTIAANIAQRIDNAKLVEEDRSRNKEVINIYAAAAEARDPHTYGHSEAVTRYAVAIAKEMALPVEDIRKIEHAGILHDIGKIGISDQVLNKPGRLTPEERELICKHPLIGDKLIRQYSNLDDIAPIALHHHENYDGKGYPSGISGEVIPLGARILAVADAFDAMTSNRPYRTALSLPEAKAELRKNRGTQFDPQVVNAFLKIANTIFNREKRLRKKRPAEIIKFPTATLKSISTDEELIET